MTARADDIKDTDLCTSCKGWEDRPHTHLSMPDPPGTTRLDLIRERLAGR